MGAKSWKGDDRARERGVSGISLEGKRESQFSSRGLQTRRWTKMSVGDPGAVGRLRRVDTGKNDTDDPGLGPLGLI